MKNGVGVAQSIVLFGGTSDIGHAIVDKVVLPGTSRLVLISRDTAAAQKQSASLASRFPDLDIHHVTFDASDVDRMVDVVDEVTRLAGDIDIAIVAHGVLHEGFDYFAQPGAVARVIDVNTTGQMALLYALSGAMRAQGYGKIVLLSSVAGARVRKANPVYGASKAAIDGFALALDHELEDTGVSLLVVRPGFVMTKMTAGMKKAPLSTTPDKVAALVARALQADKKVVWTPTLLGPLFTVLRALPGPVWRRLPL